MRVFILLLVPLVAALSAPTGGTRAQGTEKADAPKLNLTLTAEKTAWKAGEKAPVRVRVENVSGGRVEIASVIYFRADNRMGGGDRVTMAHGVFWSPVSLRKTYAEHSPACQNDLSADRVRSVKGTNAVEIFPSREALILEKGEAREFSFDMAGVCWNHSIGAFYPNSHIFPLAARYDLKTYDLYFEMRSPGGAAEAGGAKAPPAPPLKSNVVEITIN